MARIGLITLAAMAVATPALAQAGWVGVWQAAPALQVAAPGAPLKPIRDQTVRQVVRPSIAVRRVRITLSNAYGSRPLVVGAASLARQADGQVQGAPKPLTFAGAPAVTIPVGASMISDPVDLDVPALGEAAVSLYLPQETLPETFHKDANEVVVAGTRLGRGGEAAISPPGDFTGQAAMPGGAASPRLFVTRLDALAPRTAGAIVVMATTRTEGEGRWPDILARRLGGRRAVVGAWIVANNLTRPFAGGGEAGAARLDRDVLLVPGVSHLVIADMINDIGQAAGASPDTPVPTAEQLEAVYRQMTARAHARGVKVIAATVLPFAGTPFPKFYTAEKEKVREDLNQWIRTAGVFDGVIDMDRMVRDPADPTRYAPDLGAGNHLVPNDAGEKVIGEGIDLALFK